MPSFHYGFDWRPRAEAGYRADGDGSGDSSEDDDFSLRKQRLEDCTVRFPRGQEYTLGFQVGDYEYDGAKFCEAAAFPVREPAAESQAGVVGTAEIWLFDVEGCADELGSPLAPGGGLHMVADSITQEVTDAVMALLTPRGEPIGSFRRRCGAARPLDHVLYVSGVYVDTECQGHGLGLVLLQELVAALKDADLFAGDSMVLLCPAGDPPNGSQYGSHSAARWNDAFSSLSRHFGGLGFQPCGAEHARSADQGMYMYCAGDALAERPIKLE